MENISKLLTAFTPLLWPIVTIVVVLLFRRNIQDVLSHGFRGKILGQEIELSGIVKEAKSAVEEAKDKINELQELSKIMGSAVLTLTKRSGRLSLYSDEDKEEIKDSVIDLWRRLGISDEEINNIKGLTEWHQFVKFDYAYFILGGGRTPSNLTTEQQQQWEELRNRKLDNIASPQAIEKFLVQCGRLSEEAKELIKDFKYYHEHQTYRRPDVWENRGNWSHLR